MEEEGGGPLDGYCETFFSKALELSLFPQKPHKKGPDECFSARGIRHFEISYRGGGKNWTDSRCEELQCGDEESLRIHLWCFCRILNRGLITWPASDEIGRCPTHWRNVNLSSGTSSSRSTSLTSSTTMRRSNRPLTDLIQNSKIVGMKMQSSVRKHSWNP